MFVTPHRKISVHLDDLCDPDIQDTRPRHEGGGTRRVRSRGSGRRASFVELFEHPLPKSVSPTFGHPPLYL